MTDGPASIWQLRDNAFPPDDPRTVADVAGAAYSGWNASDAYRILPSLGIDPDMPYSQFRHRLKLGERAERAAHVPYDTSTGYDCEYDDGWNACLNHIQGDQT